MGTMFVIDFDGTVASTLEASPNGIGVNEGYKYAIEMIFGEEGLTVFKKIGGLRNRAPTELTKALLEKDESSLLFNRACTFFNENRKILKNSVPKGKGFSLEWPERAVSINTVMLRTISEMLVRLKLSFLMKEIGTIQQNGKTWPEPCRGFIDFFEFIQEMNKEKGNFRIVILSSGHEFFIKEVFRSWDISPLPDMLTDDDLRDSNLEETVAKPSAVLFDILENKMKENKEKNKVLNPKDTIYIGDDPKKDGELAENAGIPFMLFCKNSDNFRDGCHCFDDWKKIIAILKKQQTSG